LQVEAGGCGPGGKRARIGADALVTHDRDFSALRDLRVLAVETKTSAG
jgi:hypothetical protein